MRAHDRRSLVVTHPLSAQAFRASADAVIPFDEFAEAAMAEEPPTGAAPRPAAMAPIGVAPIGVPPAGVAAPEPHAPPLADAPPMADATPDPGDPPAQRAAILALLRQLVAGSADPLHLPALGKRIHTLGGAWVRQSRFGGAGTLAKLIEGAEGLALEAGPGGGWLYDPARHDRPSLQQPGLPDDPLSRLMGALRGAIGQGGGPGGGQAPEVPHLGPEELDFALRGLAGLLPLAAPPGPEQRAALGAEAMAAGIDLPGRAIESLFAWLTRARVDWRATPDAETPGRFGRALFAEITRAAAAAGNRLAPDTLTALRDWIGLEARRGPELVPDVPMEIPMEASLEVPMDAAAEAGTQPALE